MLGGKGVCGLLDGPVWPDGCMAARQWDQSRMEQHIAAVAAMIPSLWWVISEASIWDKQEHPHLECPAPSQSSLLGLACLGGGGWEQMKS